MPIAKENDMDKLLTIAIPTYNRAAKLKRLLAVLQDEIVTSCLQEQIDVLISDNASIDDTSSIAYEFTDSNFSLEYYRQPENLGFDGNLRFLYTQSRTKFVWFLADDDIPLPGSLSRIVRTLEENQLDILLFGFLQPSDRRDRVFNFPQPLHIVDNPAEAIELVLRYGKVSIYVLRKVVFSASELTVLDEFFGDEFYFLSLAFSVLETSPDLSLGIISEPLAKCDEDWMILNSLPMPGMLNEVHVIEHPFVKKHCPDLSDSFRNEMYYTTINFSYLIKTGFLIIPDTVENDRFIHNLEWKIFLLLKRPRVLFEFFALKSRIPTFLLLKFRYIYRRIKSILASNITI